MADDHPTRGDAGTESGWPVTVADLDGSRIQIDPDRLVNLTDVPWESARRTFRWIKKTFVTAERSDVPSLRVGVTRARIRKLLGTRHFEPNWEFSTYYAGEVLNLRRVRYADPDGLRWWQVHVRGFRAGDGLELDPHWEPEPTQHPNAHLSEDHIDVERGIERLARILDEADVEYERLDADSGGGGAGSDDDDEGGENGGEDGGTHTPPGTD